MRENATRQRAGPDAVEGGVLAIVQALVIELGGRAPTAVTRHARLDHDLGIGSLERVELLLRLEQQFGVRLPDAVMAEAGTPDDLIAAIRGAAPARPEPALEMRPPVAPGVAAPADARTLTSLKPGSRPAGFGSEMVTVIFEPQTNRCRRYCSSSALL